MNNPYSREDLPQTKMKQLLLLLRKKSHSLKELSDKLKLSLDEVGKILIYLGFYHPGISRSGDSFFIDEAALKGADGLEFWLDPKEEKTGRIGIVSCTHFGSKYMQLSHLYNFYEQCEKRNVDRIINCGDVTDGTGYVYRGQRFEMFLQGYDEQLDYLVEMYPKSSIPTDFISGNHDDSFVKGSGSDIIREACRLRKDFSYYGRYMAYLNLRGGKIRTRIHHAEGGLAYAISYKFQKYIETLSSEEKPQLYLLGHYHKEFSMFSRNIHCIQIGCFQSQTPYLRRKSLNPDVCGTIIDYSLANDNWSIGSIKKEIIPYYKHIKNDYKNFPQ